jgi:putative nucleotidyltransferase with HDIG domain
MSQPVHPEATPGTPASGGAQFSPPRPVAVGRLLNAQTVARCVQDLPALPHALVEVLAALRQEGLHIERCAALIERDQALCGRTLRLANSPFYGLSGRISSIRDALQLLGLGTVGTLMTAALLSARFDPHQCSGFDFRRFMRHAIGASIAARELARATGHNEAEAGLAGLLHDVGQLALAAYFPAELSAALGLARSADCPVAEAERALMNLDHAEVGGLVARHWCFPSAMAEAIEQHHRTERGDTLGSTSALSDIVHLADVVVHALNVAQDPDEHVPPVSLEAWNRLRPNALPMAKIFAAIEDGVDAVCAELQL